METCRRPFGGPPTDVAGGNAGLQPKVPKLDHGFGIRIPENQADGGRWRAKRFLFIEKEDCQFFQGPPGRPWSSTRLRATRTGEKSTWLFLGKTTAEKQRNRGGAAVLAGGKNGAGTGRIVEGLPRIFDSAVVLWPCTNGRGSLCWGRPEDFLGLRGPEFGIFFF